MEIVHEARTHGSDVMDVQAPLPCKKCLFPRVTMTVTLTLTPSHQDMSILRTTYVKSSLEKITCKKILLFKTDLSSLKWTCLRDKS
jgi:hypothetical protein